MRYERIRVHVRLEAAAVPPPLHTSIAYSTAEAGEGLRTEQDKWVLASTVVNGPTSVTSHVCRYC